MAGSVAEAVAAEESRANAIPQAEYNDPIQRDPQRQSMVGGIMKLHHKWTNSLAGKILAPGLGTMSDMVMKKMLKDKYSKVLGDHKNEHAGVFDLAMAGGPPGTEPLNENLLAKYRGMGGPGMGGDPDTGEYKGFI